MTAPLYVKENPRAKQIFASVVKYIKANGGPEKVYVEMVAVYAHSCAEYEEMCIKLAEGSYLISDDKGNPRRNPIEIIRNAAYQQMIQTSKVLGINRDFHMKGREKAISLGKPMSKVGRLRKVTAKAS